MSSKRLLLVGWDAADWKVIHPLLDAGRMPNLAGIVEGGVMADMATLRPCYSPMLWSSIATGKRASKHGVHGFTEVTPDGRGVRPVTGLSRRTKALWNILHQTGHRSVVVGWWPSHPVEPIRGAMVSDHFHKVSTRPGPPPALPPGAVHPVEWAEELASLRLQPSELRLNEVLPFVPKGEEIDQSKDRRLATLAKLTCEALNINTAATWLLDRVDWDVAAVYFDAIDHYSHAFMRYRAPRQSWVPESDFELYQHVIDSAYILHDLMLGALLSRTSADTTVLVLSDHGFHPDHLRPRRIPREPAGPALEHRDFGIFAARGPALKRDQLIHGVNLLDVTPTVLALLGLPVGDDMDGRPVLDAFVVPPAIRRIPSWDGVPGDAARHPPESQIDPVAARESLRQLVAMGYVEPLPENAELAVRQTARELRFNLAQSLVDEDRHADALVIFRELHLEEPDEFRFAYQRASCCLALGLLDELGVVVEDLDVRRRDVARRAAEEFRLFARSIRDRLRQESASPPSAPAEAASPQPGTGAQPRRRRVTPDERRRLRELRAKARFNPFAVRYLAGQLHLARGRPQAALELFLEAEKTATRRPGMHLQIGRAYLGMKQWNDAQRSFLAALDLDPGNPHAQLGLAECFLNQRRVRMAAEAALAALGRMHHLPMGHFLLARALARLRRPAAAAKAVRQALALNPHFPQAHDFLAQLLEKRLGDPTQAAEHRRLARDMRAAAKPADRSSATPPGSRPSSAPPASTSPLPAPNLSHSQAPSSLARVPAESLTGQPVIVVTGLPRSGTSLAMQMLAAGGVPARTDGLRTPDADNPRGYFEFEPVKRLPRDTDWLETTRGQAVKVVVPLLPSLPDRVPYRVVFIDRHPDEIAASQQAMLNRQGFGPSALAPEAWREELHRQRHRALQWLEARPHIPVLRLLHADVVSRPADAAAALNAFFGGALDVTAMTAAVDPKLHRHQSPRPPDSGL